VLPCLFGTPQFLGAAMLLGLALGFAGVANLLFQECTAGSNLLDPARLLGGLFRVEFALRLDAL